MKKILFTALLVLSAAGAKAATPSDAYEYPYLTFQTTDGATEVIAVESLTLTVADGQLVARNAATAITLPLDKLSKMYFTSNATGIAAASADTMSGDGVEVFSLLGTSVGRFGSISQAQASLARGIYVVKTNEGTQKIAVR